MAKQVHKFVPRALPGQEGLTTVPRKVTPEIKAFCKEVAPGSTPVLLKITPMETSENSECFSNVERYISMHGGKIQYGWIIWETPNVMLEAEFHAVWQASDGRLVDITPSNDGEGQILFIPDNKRRYQGVKIDNIRKSICKNQIVGRFIKNAEKMSMMMRDLGNEFNQQDIMGMVSSIPDYFEVMTKFTDFVARKRGPNDPCICGSGKKQKLCCGAST